jgi:hypothetical protein
LIAALSRGEYPVPAFELARQRVDAFVYRAIDEALALARASPLADLYVLRLSELELDLAILDAWGDSKLIRPLSARRYGRGSEPVPTSEGEQPLCAVARALLATLPVDEHDSRTLPADAGGNERSVASYMRRAALGIGLDVEVRVEPRLASLAATGERTVFLADRCFSEREACRLTAHEVFGHLVVAANARAQPLRLLQIGVHGSFADQEGLALVLEEMLGFMGADRLRTLAGRVLATALLHEGAQFGDTARCLLRDHGFSPPAAIAIAERAYRGGGVARDAGYLAGFLRVRGALRAGEVGIDELRRGRVSVSAIPRLRELEGQGYVVPACYRPSLSLSRALTLGGTKADTSPPNEAASLTILELT